MALWLRAYFFGGDFGVKDAQAPLWDAASFTRRVARGIDDGT